MTWFLIILNVYGGTPAFIEMPTEATCQWAVAATAPIGGARSRCIPAGEWPALEE